MMEALNHCHDLLRTVSSITEARERLTSLIDQLKNSVLDDSVFPYFSSFSAFLFHDFLPKWSLYFSSVEKREILYLLFTLFPPDFSLFALNECLSDASEQFFFEKEFAAMISLHLFSNKSFLDHLLKKIVSCHWSLSKQNLVLQIIVSFSDKIFNLLKINKNVNSKVLSFFQRHHYFSYVAEKIQQWIFSLDNDIFEKSASFLILFIKKLCHVGYQNEVIISLLHCGDRLQPLDRIRALVCGSGSFSQRLIVGLFCRVVYDADCPEAATAFLDELFGPLFSRDRTYWYVLVDFLLVDSALPLRMAVCAPKVLCNVAEELRQQATDSSSDTCLWGELIQNGLQRLVGLWASPHFSNRTSFAQEKYVSISLAYLLRNIPTDKAIENSGVFSLLFSGVQDRFENELFEYRLSGMFVAQALSCRISNGTPLNFGNQDELDGFEPKWIEMASLRSSRSKSSWLQNWFQPRNVASETENAKTNSAETDAGLTETNTNQKQSAEIKIGQVESQSDEFNKTKGRKKQRNKPFRFEDIDPDELVSLGGDWEEQEEKELDSSDVEDCSENEFGSEDSLEAYEFSSSDAEAFDADAAADRNTGDERKPKHMSEYVEYLSANSNDSHVYAKHLYCLEHLDAAISLNSPDLEEYCVLLAERMLSLLNDYNMPQFEERRRKILCSLLLACPEPILSHITNEFYAENVALPHRLDILNMMLDALDAISQPLDEKNDNLSVRFKEMAVSERCDDDEKLHQQQDTKTRRWGYAAHPPRPPRPLATAQYTKMNASSRCSLAGLFFFPLLKAFDVKRPYLHLLGYDSMLLVRLLLVLSRVIEVAGPSLAYGERMCLAFLDFLQSISDHPHHAIRRGVVLSLSKVINLLAVTNNLRVIMNTLPFWMHWLQYSYEKYADSETRTVAAAVFKTLVELIRPQELSSNYLL